jgi:hypothetical protein
MYRRDRLMHETVTTKQTTVEIDRTCSADDNAARVGGNKNCIRNIDRE